MAASSELKVEDEKLLELLAISTEKKKKDKKKKATKADGAVDVS